MESKDLFIVNSRCANILNNIENAIFIVGNNFEIFYANNHAKKLLVGKNFYLKKINEIFEFDFPKKESGKISAPMMNGNSKKEYVLNINRFEDYYIIEAAEKNFDLESKGNIEFLNELLIIFSKYESSALEKKVLESFMRFLDAKSACVYYIKNNIA